MFPSVSVWIDKDRLETGIGSKRVVKHWRVIFNSHQNATKPNTAGFENTAVLQYCKLQWSSWLKKAQTPTNLVSLPDASITPITFTDLTILMNSGFLASTYPIEHSMWSLVRPALGPACFSLWYNFRKNNKVTIQTKFSQRLLPDLFTFLSSIRGFRDTSEALENQVNANVGEVFLSFVFFMAT